jgi:hypothetical protein
MLPIIRSVFRTSVSSLVVTLCAFGCGGSSGHVRYPNDAHTLGSLESGGVRLDCNVTRTDTTELITCPDGATVSVNASGGDLNATCLVVKTDTCDVFMKKLMDESAPGLAEPAPEAESHAGRLGDITPAGVAPALLDTPYAALEAKFGKPDETTAMSSGRTFNGWFARGISVIVAPDGTIANLMLHSGRVGDEKYKPYVGSSAEGFNIDSTRSGLRKVFGQAFTTNRKGATYRFQGVLVSFMFTPEQRLMEIVFSSTK